jgi:hypothetical protein
VRRVKQPVLKGLDLRYSGKKVRCTCCGRRWVDEKTSITRPCKCAEYLLCGRCNHCLKHCECVGR